MTTTAVRARREKDEEELRVRYERAISSANQWMDRQYATKTRLADFLDVNRSCLTRFLNGTPGYQPARTRPSILRILERIEARCAVHELVEQQELEAPSGETFDDAYTWFHNHALRLRHLTERFEPVTALGLVPELSAQALHGPKGYRAVMAANVLRHLSAVVARPELACATPKLLRITVNRARVLADHASRFAAEIEREEVRAATPHRARGWAGHVLARCALHLGDEALLRGSLAWMSDAAGVPHALEDAHWANLLGVVDALVEHRCENAEDVVDGLAELVRHTRDEKAFYALTSRPYPHLLRQWRERAPDLAARAPDAASNGCEVVPRGGRAEGAGGF